MNVLSLFDGMSCGRIALERAGIKVNSYYSSEIDKYAIQIANKNYPQDADKRLGDVTKWQYWNIDWSSIDLVTGGFPCQAWSIAGKQQGDRDERGMLFWTMLDIMKKVLEHNPKANFLIENVKMKKEFEEYITLHTTQALGTVYKYLINSALVSAQNRQRYYWTNIEGIEQPEDKGILLRDILEDDIQSLRPCELREYKQDSICHHIADATDIKGNECIKRVYADSGKAPTLTTMTGGHREPKVLIDTDIIVRATVQKNAEHTYNGKCPTLTAAMCLGGGNVPLYTDKETADKFKGKYIDKNDRLYYRKLTPLECERLQTVPDKVFYGIIRLKDLVCLDQAKNYVSAVEKNHRLQRLVLSAEKYELREYVNNAIKSMNVNHQSIKPTAQKNVDMQMQSQIEKCTNIKEEELNTTAKIVEKRMKHKCQEKEEDFAVANVLMNLIEGKIAHNGKVESLLKDNNIASLENGKSVLSLSFQDMMELAKDVELGIQKIRGGSTTFTTSYPLSIENIETMLIISYYFARDVIDGYIPTKIQINNLYLSLTNGYTFGVSNSQRYKMLGNGWTCDVIAHIFKSLK